MGVIDPALTCITSSIRQVALSECVTCRAIPTGPGGTITEVLCAVEHSGAVEESRWLQAPRILRLVGCLKRKAECLMDVRVSESLPIRASAEQTFAHAITDVDTLARTVHPTGPLPGVVKTEVIGARTLAVGSVRRVHLSDGRILNEEIVDLQPPKVMAYRQLTAFPFPFSVLARGAHGRYLIDSSGDVTELTWEATIDGRTPLSYPFLAVLRSLFLRRMMRGFLEGVRDTLESGIAASTAKED